MGDERKIRLHWKMPLPPQKSAGRSVSRDRPRRKTDASEASGPNLRRYRLHDNVGPLLTPYCQHSGGVGTTTVVIVM
jgi:hypothetical protein